MSKLTLTFTAVALCGGLAATATLAMPITSLTADMAVKIEQVRWVCGPYGRCWRQPNYYGGYYDYGPPRYSYQRFYRPWPYLGYRWRGPYW